jgi:mono/diheme cytochrome c family protein
MDRQDNVRGQKANPLFADGRAMRPPVAGTVARGELREDGWLYRGVVGDDWAAGFPVEVTASTLSRGRERYEVFCTPCHGMSGYGDGIVAKRAENLQEGTWVPPSSFHTDLVRTRPVGHLYNSITNGIRNMPAYGSQIPVEDRWAIVAYVRALQRSQNARIEDVPEELRPNLR